MQVSFLITKLIIIVNILQRVSSKCGIMVSASIAQAISAAGRNKSSDFSVEEVLRLLLLMSLI